MALPSFHEKGTQPMNIFWILLIAVLVASLLIACLFGYAMNRISDQEPPTPPQKGE
jgi:uncharacterized membrane protein AbrB (regulator of aidB expression)